MLEKALTKMKKMKKKKMMMMKEENNLDQMERVNQRRMRSWLQKEAKVCPRKT